MNSDPPRLLDDPSASPSLRADLARAADARLEGLDLDAGLERLRTATRTGSSGPSGTSLATKLSRARTWISTCLSCEVALSGSRTML